LSYIVASIGNFREDVRFAARQRWKYLADSDNDPIYLAGRRTTWRDWERREDYYTEGSLLWLGVDAQIRRLTDGKKTLRDFARGFFAAGSKQSLTHFPI